MTTSQLLNPKWVICKCWWGS